LLTELLLYVGSWMVRVFLGQVTTSWWPGPACTARHCQ